MLIPLQLTSSGRAHNILVPYIDENGIPQAPRFGLSSYKGEAIRKLASELYQQVVNEKRESAKFLSKVDKQPLNQEPALSPSIDDPPESSENQICKRRDH